MVKNTFKKSAVALAAVVALGGGAGLATLASAQATTGTTDTSPPRKMMGIKVPHVQGTITAINGGTITIASKNKTGESTYTVNADSAVVTKDGTATTLTGLAVGNRIMVEGTVSGTTVTATKIFSGTAGFGFGKGRGHEMGKNAGVSGTVTAVTGNTLTVKKADGTSYTVEASNAKISKIVTLSVSDIKVGDIVGVQGSVSGTSVTATHIMDGIPPRPQAPPATQ